MVEVIEQALKKKQAIEGRPKKLSIEQMLRMTFEYLRNIEHIFIFQKAMESVKVIAIIPSALLKKPLLKVANLVCQEGKHC